MQQNKMIMYSLLAVVVVAAGILVITVYSPVEVVPAPDYLAFFPEDPLIQFESEGLKKLPGAVRNLEIFTKSKEVGLPDEFRSHLEELLEEEEVVSAAREKIKEITGFTTGKLSAGLLQGREGNIQLLAVLPLDRDPDITEEKLREGEGQLPEFIREHWLDEIEENLVYETGSTDGVEIHSFYAQDAPAFLQTSLAVTPENYLLVGIGRRAVEDALYRRDTSGPVYSILSGNDEEPRMAFSLDQRLLSVLVSRAEEHIGSNMEDKVSFSGIREKLDELFAGLKPVQMQLGFQDGKILLQSELNYELQQLHPLHEYFLDITPVTSYDSSRFFSENTVSFGARPLPRPGELYRRLTETVVDMANAGAGEDVKGQVDQGISFFRMFLPEQEIEDLLNTIDGEVAFGSVLASDFTGGEIELSMLAGRTLVVLELTDYEDFASRLENFNQYELFNFDRTSGRISFAGGEMELFLDNRANWLLISDSEEALAESREVYDSGNNLQNYQAYRDIRAEQPASVSEVGYYSLAPYASLLEQGAFADEVPQELGDFYEDIQPMLARLAGELSPASAFSVNDPSAGQARSTLESPGGTILILGMLSALPDIADAQDEMLGAAEDVRISAAKSEIATVQSAFIQCSMDNDCDETELNESWSNYLPEKIWSDDVSPGWEIVVRNDDLKAVYLRDVGGTWTDEASSRGRGMVYLPEEGKFYAHSCDLEKFDRLQLD